MRPSLRSSLRRPEDTAFGSENGEYLGIYIYIYIYMDMDIIYIYGYMDMDIYIYMNP